MTDSFKLASEFPPADYASWRQLAEAGLKGAAFDKKLVTRTLDGFDIQPLYTAEHHDSTTQLIHDVLVMAEDDHDGTAGWDIRQLHHHPDPAKANAAILDDLENGATSVLLRLDTMARHGETAPITAVNAQDGIFIRNLDDLDAVLDGVYTDLATIALDGGQAGIATAALLAVRLETGQTENGNDSDAPGANSAPAFNLDPLGAIVRNGTLPGSIDSNIAQAADISCDLIDRFPMATAMLVDGTPYYNAGATDGQELAFMLAGGVAYLRALCAAGMAVDQAAGAIAFDIAIGTDFFAGIAKLRALRLCWTRILTASGADDASITINARTAEMALGRVDPWVNMLRSTVTSFAAGLGGADSVICLPFDHMIGLPDGFSRRIARNTQLILQEESNVHRVIDPAGGSWFIENLTRELAQNAWTRFQSLEASGGIAPALRSGQLQREIADIWQERQKRLATRRDPLTGISEFPDIAQAPLTPEIPDIDAIQARQNNRKTRFDGPIAPDLAGLMDAGRKGADIWQMMDALNTAIDGEKTTIMPLPQHRLGESFEALRARADTHKAETGAFPRIFLANLGKVAQHTARATFARNFFEAGGIAAIANTGFDTADDCAAAFAQSGADIAVICGTDGQYGDMALPVAAALKAAGASRLYLAGHPGDGRDRYQAGGIDDFIFIGADVLAVCGTALDHLGVKQS